MVKNIKLYFNILQKQKKERIKILNFINKLKKIRETKVIIN